MPKWSTRRQATARPELRSRWAPEARGWPIPWAQPAPHDNHTWAGTTEETLLARVVSCFSFGFILDDGDFPVALRDRIANLFQTFDAALPGGSHDVLLCQP